MTKTFVTKQASETEAAGEWLAGRLRGGQVVCLSGDLGGGKTTFMKGLARGLGVARTITSPTFVVEAVHQCKIQNSKCHRFKRGPAKGSGKIRTVYHFDVYRVKSAAEVLALGWEEVLADPDGVVVVEWAERIAEILPPRCIWVRFKFVDQNTREIRISARGGSALGGKI